jgi:uncharacterized protein YcbX
MKISDIIHYPVKSLAGNQLLRSEVHERGLEDDRRFMLIDDHNVFMSQRKIPQLCHVEVGITEDHIVLRDRRNNESIRHKLEFELQKTEVSIWKTITTSHLFLYKELDEWISDRMGTKLRFAYMDESDHRPINPKYAKADEIVSFADGYPILVCNSASLKALNESLSKPIAMAHFRPNLVIDHDIAWAEDQWKRLKIGGVILRIPKPCARCTVITIDPDTGEKNPEVLIQLGKKRMIDGKILFGANAIVEQTGVIKRNDKVEIVD